MSDTFRFLNEPSFEFCKHISMNSWFDVITFISMNDTSKIAIDSFIGRFRFFSIRAGDDSPKITRWVTNNRDHYTFRRLARGTESMCDLRQVESSHDIDIDAFQNYTKFRPKQLGVST